MGSCQRQKHVQAKLLPLLHLQEYPLQGEHPTRCLQHITLQSQQQLHPSHRRLASPILFAAGKAKSRPAVSSVSFVNSGSASKLKLLGWVLCSCTPSLLPSAGPAVTHAWPTPRRCPTSIATAATTATLRRSPLRVSTPSHPCSPILFAAGKAKSRPAVSSVSFENSGSASRMKLLGWVLCSCTPSSCAHSWGGASAAARESE